MRRKSEMSFEIEMRVYDYEDETRDTASDSTLHYMHESRRVQILGCAAAFDYRNYYDTGPLRSSDLRLVRYRSLWFRLNTTSAVLSRRGDADADGTAVLVLRQGQDTLRGKVCVGQNCFNKGETH